MKPKKNPVTGRFEGFGIDQALRSFILAQISQQPQTAWELAKLVRISTGKLYSDSTMASRVRDLRMKKFGGHNIKTRRVETSFGNRMEYYIPRETFEDRQYPLAQSA